MTAYVLTQRRYCNGVSGVNLRGVRDTHTNKDMTELPPDFQAQIRALGDLPEDQIDTSDAPEILDWADARRGVLYQPVKQQT